MGEGTLKHSATLGLGADGVPEASLERSEAELSERLSLVFLVVKLKG